MSETAVEFRCPGEAGAISRAVHLARLAASSFTKCRECPHRTDTGSFSSRRAKQIAEAFAAGPCPALPDGDMIGGTLLSELTPAVARRAGAAFGVFLREWPSREREGAVQVATDAPAMERVACLPLPLPHGRGSDCEGGSVSEGWPTVLLAGDGRRLTSSLVAAVADGLRFGGCHVIDMGRATSGCLAFALRRSGADAGLLVGNSGHRTHQAGLSFWVGGRPVALTPEQRDRILHGHVDRPAREFGSLGRASFEADYLATLAEWYHGVRPLAVVIETACGPLVDYVRQLSASLECRFIEDPSRPAESLVVEWKAHFGMRIDGNGEAACVMDECGRVVPAGRLMGLIARRLVEERVEGREAMAGYAPAVVVEEESAAETEEALRGLGLRIVRAASGRAAMCRAMEEERAMIGGGASGRFWYGRSGHVAPDAMVTLSLMLAILSQSDRPLSRVLDETGAGG